MYELLQVHQIKKMKISTYKAIILRGLIGTVIGLFSFSQSANAAKEVALINGAFKRTIKVKEIKNLAQTGKTKGYLKQVLNISNQNPKEVSNILNKEIELSLVLTSRLMNSKIGEALLGRLSKVIHPLKMPQESISIPAIRAGVINGLVASKGHITIVNFLQAYPTDIIAVDIPELSKLIKKADSINELIKFFSGSPLENLKKGKL